MSYEAMYSIPEEKAPVAGGPPPPREEVIAQIRQGKRFDILVIGGDFYSTSLARLAALNDFQVLLVTAGDFGSEPQGYVSGATSLGCWWRSSTLRRWRSRSEVQCIAAISEAAPHLTRLEPILVLHPRGYKEGYLGAACRAVENRLSRKILPPTRWIPLTSLVNNLESCGVVLQSDHFAGASERWECLGGYSRLAVESSIAARQEGATCLNYIRCEDLGRRTKDGLMVAVVDELTGNRFYLHGAAVMNCETLQIGHPTPDLRWPSAELADKDLHYHRYHETSLVFDFKWPAPTLLVPASDFSPSLRGRSSRSVAANYLIRSHPSGTSVSYLKAEPLSAALLKKYRANARDEKESKWDDTSEVEEVSKVIALLAQKVLTASLTAGRVLSYHRRVVAAATTGASLIAGPLAGIKSLSCSPGRDWFWNNGIASLVTHRGASVAPLVALAGLEELVAQADIPRKIRPLKSRPLPGGVLPEALDDFYAAGRQRGVDTRILDRAVARFGGKVARFIEVTGDLDILGPATVVPLLRGEVRYAIEHEQVATIEDLLSRRLGVASASDHGLAVLDRILEENGLVPEHIRQSAEEYRSKVLERDRNLAALRLHL